MKSLVIRQTDGNKTRIWVDGNELDYVTSFNLSRASGKAATIFTVSMLVLSELDIALEIAGDDSLGNFHQNREGG